MTRDDDTADATVATHSGSGSPLPVFAWLAVAAASLVVGAAAFAFVFAVAPSAQRYPEFVVGFLAWVGKGKDADLWSIPIALAAAIAAAVATHRVALAVRTRAGLPALEAFVQQLVLWAAPGFAAIGLLFYNFTVDVLMLDLAAIAVLVVVGATVLALRKALVDPTVVSFALFAAFLFALAPIEWALLRDRLAPDGSPASGDVATASPAIFALGAAMVIGCCALAPERLAALASRALAIGNMGLPLLFLLIYPPKFALANGDFLRYPVSTALVLLIAALMAWAWWDLARRAILARPIASAYPAALISPVALFALLVGVRYGYTLLPQIPSDDFHFGVVLLGSWSLLHFHALPYVDHILLHGILEDGVPGYVSTLLFDGTAATIAEAQRLVYIALAGGAYWAMLRLTGSVITAFASATMLGARAAWFFLAPLFCLAADPSRPERWLGLWLIAVPIVILAVPGQGVLALAATAPVAGFVAWRWWRSGAPRLRSVPTTVAVAIAALALFTPLGRMLAGALVFVAEFGLVNEVAFGVPWAESFRPENHPTFANELIRMSWVAVPVMAAALIAFVARAEPRRTVVLAAALPALLFPLLLIPYTMGRIDPIEMSRPGIMGVLGFTVLVPVMAWAAWPGRFVPAMALAIAGAAAVLGANPSLTRLLHAADPRAFPGDPHKAAAKGLRSMGEGIVDDAHLDRVLGVRQALDAVLPAGAPYLDLTNRHALYFYLDREPVLPITDYYDLVPVREQRRAVAILEKKPPGAALLYADNFAFDGGTLALRAPLLFRFVLDTYQPYARERLILGRLRSAPPRSGQISEAELALLDRVFAQRDLQWVPAAWGASAESLRGKMDPASGPLDASPHSTYDLVAEGNVQRVTGQDPQISYDVSAHAISPTQAGLLKFDFHCVKPAHGAIPRLQMFYWGDRQDGPTEQQSFYFNAIEGTMIVPLDAYPRYLSLDLLRGLRIDLDNAGACAAIDVRNLRLFQRHAVLDYARLHARGAGSR